MTVEPANYLAMDCPNCGRARLWAYVQNGQIRIRCEKCAVSEFDCDETEHEKGGPHPQHASAYEQIED